MLFRVYYFAYQRGYECQEKICVASSSSRPTRWWRWRTRQEHGKPRVGYLGNSARR